LCIVSDNQTLIVSARGNNKTVSVRLPLCLCLSPSGIFLVVWSCMAVLCVCYRLLLLDRLAVACVLTGIVQIIPMAGAIAAESIRNPWGSCSTCSSTMHTAATLRGSCDLDGVGCWGQGTYGCRFEFLCRGSVSKFGSNDGGGGRRCHGYPIP